MDWHCHNTNHHCSYLCIITPDQMILNLSPSALNLSENLMGALVSLLLHAPYWRPKPVTKAYALTKNGTLTSGS